MPQRPRSSLRALVLFLLLWSASAGVTSALECPEGQYPYSCSTCLRIADTEKDFEASRENCESEGGELISVGDEMQFHVLGRYLSGLNNSRRLWIGYRYNSLGEQMAITGDEVPDLVFTEENFLTGDMVGNESDCIGVKEGIFFTAPCSESLGFVCSCTYEVPRLRNKAGGTLYTANGETVSLDVQFEGLGLGVSGMIWRHSGTDIGLQYGTVISTSTSSQLTIPSFDLGSHLGRYDFVAVSPAGATILAIWEIRQAVLGDMTIHPQALSIPQGQIATFECEAANARPRPTVSWYKDSVLLDVSSDRFYVSEITRTLFIRDVSSVDTGLYRCTLENVAGSIDSQPANLSIDNTASLSVILSPRNTTLLVGETYSLECGGTRPTSLTSTYTFLDMAYRMVSLGTFTYPTQDGFPVYRVESVNLQHDLNCFFCRFGPETISFGAISITTGKSILTVHLPSAVKWISATVNGMESFASLQTVPPNTSVTLWCSFTGIPIPVTAVWTVDGKTIGETPITGNSSTIEVLELSGGGVYQCQGANQYGVGLAEIVLCEGDGLPGPVTYNATSDTNASIYVTWSPPSIPNTHPLLLQYEVVTIATSEGFRGSSGLLPAHVTRFVVSGLNGGSEYEICVVAYSLVGQGERGPHISAYTFANAPNTTIPDDDILLSSTVDDMALIVSWTYTPTPRNFIGYELQYRDGNQTTVETVSLGQEENSFTILGLSNARQHEVRIRVAVQLQREPRLLDYSPWSGWQEVQSIAELPSPSPSPSSHPLPPGPVSPEGEEDDEPLNGLLLIIVLTPVAVIILAVFLVVVIGVSCWYSKRPEKSYRPAKQERSGWGERQVPMGNSIFSLPIPPEIADQVERQHVNDSAFDSMIGTLDDSGVSLTASPPVISKDNLAVTSFHLTNDA